MGGNLNIKRLSLIKENQISHIKKFSAFLYMGRCKSLGSLKVSLSYASQLSGVSIQVFSHPELPWGSWQGLPAVWWLLDHRYSSPSWVPLGLTSSHWTAKIPDDCGMLVYWLIRQEIFHFSNLKTVWIWNLDSTQWAFLLLHACPCLRSLGAI